MRIIHDSAGAGSSGAARPLPSGTSAGLPLVLLGAALLGAFGVWLLPSVVAVFMAQTRADLTYSEWLALLALTGLSASCLRLTLGFWLQRSYGRGLLLGALVLLLLISVALTAALCGREVTSRLLPWLFLLAGLGGGGLAALTGPAGEPSEEQRYGLEAASLVGHLGAVISLLVLPYLVTLPLPWGHGDRLWLASSHFLGRIDVGASIHLEWAGIFWVGFCFLVLALWSISGCWREGLALPQWRRALLALLLGLVLSALVGWVILPRSLGGAALPVPPELSLLCLLILCVLLVTALTPDDKRRRLVHLLGHRHLWLMSLLWLASLGTFLGLTLVFPLLTSMTFGGESKVFLYAWMFPLLAVLMRPVGSWAARRWGGARVVVVGMTLLTLGALCVFATLHGSAKAEYPPVYLSRYLFGVGVIFAAAGAGHAALIHALPHVFPPSLRQPAQVWLMSVATLGMVYMPLALIRAEPSGYQAFLGFALFYGLCAAVAGVLYLRRHASIYNP